MNESSVRSDLRLLADTRSLFHALLSAFCLPFIVPTLPTFDLKALQSPDWESINQISEFLDFTFTDMRL